MKVCKMCGAELPLDAFYRDRKSKDGRYWYCKVCSDLKSKAWQAAHPERHRELLLKWKHAHSDKVRASNRRYEEQHPEAVRETRRRSVEKHRAQHRAHHAEYMRQWRRRREQQ